MSKAKRYHAVPTVDVFRGAEADPTTGKRDFFWRVVSAHDSVAVGGEGYRNRKDMTGGMRSALVGLLRFFARKDRVWLEIAIGEVLRNEVEAP